MNVVRAGISLSVVSAAIAAGLFVPLPRYVCCSLEIQPRGAAAVYVEVPGQVRQVMLQAGAVAAGQPILELENVEARIAEQKILGQREQLAAKVESIRHSAHTDDSALLELAQTQEALAALDAQLDKRRDEIRRLLVRAPVAGVIVPPPARTPDGPEVKRLSNWSGRPLEVRNVGAHLESSVLLCRIMQPGELEAILAIDEQELDFVARSQAVDLYLAQFPGRRFTGRIEQISQQELQAAPQNLSAKSGGDLATRTDANGVERSVAVIYQASVPLADDSASILVGATGQAKIHTGYEPLAARLWRACRRTFHFEM